MSPWVQVEVHDLGGDNTGPLIESWSFDKE